MKLEGYIHKVQYYETDKMGIVHHSNYIRWMEEARVDFLEKIGYGFDKMEEMGVISPTIMINCKFKDPCKFNDKVLIKPKVKSYNGVKLIIEYEMTNLTTNKVSLIGESGHCFTNKEGFPIRLKKDYPEIDSILNEWIDKE